jgi:hypothetical protein
MTNTMEINGVTWVKILLSVTLINKKRKKATAALVTFINESTGNPKFNGKKRY